METPICKNCLKKEKLCSSDKKKLSDGKISKLDVKVARMLWKLRDRFRSLQEVKFLKALESKSLVLLAGSGTAAQLVGRGGRVVKELASRFGKPVLVVEPELKQVFRALLAPVPPIGVNIVFKPEGKTYKVRVHNSDKEKIPFNSKEFSAKVKASLGEEAELIFE